MSKSNMSNSIFLRMELQLHISLKLFIKHMSQSFFYMSDLSLYAKLNPISHMSS